MIALLLALLHLPPAEPTRAPYREPRTRAVYLGRPYNYKRPHKLQGFGELP